MAKPGMGKRKKTKPVPARRARKGKRNLRRGPWREFPPPDPAPGEEKPGVGIGGRMRKPLLALMGQYQTGKSTFLNCLLGGGYAAEGEGMATTKFNAKYFFGDVRGALVRHADGTMDMLEAVTELFTAQDTLAKNLKEDDCFEISVYSPALRSIDILDSPGYGVEEQDDQAVNRALEQADFVVCILQKALNKETNSPDSRFLKELRKKKKYYTVILNCMNDRDPAEVKDLCEDIWSALGNLGVADKYVALSNKEPVYPVNLLWAQTAIGYQTQETLRKNWSKVTKSFLEDKAATPLALLQRSHFLPLRALLENYARSLFQYPACGSLSTLDQLANEWKSDLLKIIQGSD